jgi:acetoin utilization protein AcuB
LTRGPYRIIVNHNKIIGKDIYENINCNQETTMRIRDVMSTNVVAVDEKTSIHDAKKIMEAHKIRRLPVMKKDKLVGLVTEHMLLEASPSPATSLSIHELHYLLAKMTVKDIMVKKPLTISPDMPPEDALQLGDLLVW